jgi:hypothetical protein
VVVARSSIQSVLESFGTYLKRIRISRGDWADMVQSYAAACNLFGASGVRGDTALESALS